MSEVPRHLIKLYQDIKDRFQDSNSESFNKFIVDLNKLEEIKNNKQEKINQAQKITSENSHKSGGGNTLISVKTEYRDGDDVK
jgi:hypothetical protein